MPKKFRMETDSFDLHVTQEEEPDASQLVESHCHEYYELIYVVQGSGRYVVEGECYPLRSNTLCLFRPREFHYVDVCPGKLYERCVIHFRPGALPEEVRPLLSKLEGKPGRGNFYGEEELPAAAATLFDRLSYLRQMPEAEGLLLARLLLSEIIVSLAVTLPSPPEECEPLGLRAVRYLNAHLTEKVDLEELARHFYVSKYYICRAFRAHNGVSVLQYITEKRVYLARQLMSKGYTAVAAAMEAGFGDYSSFYRAYVRVIGHAPSGKSNLRPLAVSEKEEVGTSVAVSIQ